MSKRVTMARNKVMTRADAYAAHWWGCYDGYDSDEEETDASRSMFS